MKNSVSIIICSFLVAVLVSFCGNSTAEEKDREFEEKLDRKIHDVSDFLAKKEYEKISRFIDYMDEQIGDDPSFYVTKAERFLLRYSRNIDDEFWPIWERVYKNHWKWTPRTNRFVLVSRCAFWPLDWVSRKNIAT